jgi:hypothetical protein
MLPPVVGCGSDVSVVGSSCGVAGGVTSTRSGCSVVPGAALLGGGLTTTGRDGVAAQAEITRTIVPKIIVRIRCFMAVSPFPIKTPREPTGSPALKIKFLKKPNLYGMMETHH